MKRPICRAFVLLTFALLISGCSDAWQFPTDVDFTEWTDEDLTALIRSRVQEGRGGGIVLGVLEADGTTRIVSYGDAGPNAQPLGAISVFEIGSITKVFTGILLADMVAKGEVSLSAPVSDYVPLGVRIPTRRGFEISMLHLATHHSGLRFMPSNFRWTYTEDPNANYTVQDLYDFLYSHELQRDPGSAFEYSNLGIALLGVVLAEVAGGSYEEMVGERILEPLGMNMTGIPIEGDIRDWITDGHDNEGDVNPPWHLGALVGAGGLRSSAQDLLTFLAANIGPAETELELAMRDSHLVRENIQESDSLDVGLDIGLTWLVFRYGDNTIVWHSGGTGGFHSFLGFDPDKGIGVVVLTNSRTEIVDVGMHLINPEIPLRRNNKFGINPPR